MSEARPKYGKLAPEGLAKIRDLKHYLNTGTALEPSLLELVRLRTSLFNGCESCIKTHTAELRKRNETEECIPGVAECRGAAMYAQRGGRRWLGPRW
jgi:AhpD family alkylhydroperoxidase